MLFTELHDLVSLLRNVLLKQIEILYFDFMNLVVKLTNQYNNI